MPPRCFLPRQAIADTIYESADYYTLAFRRHERSRVSAHEHCYTLRDAAADDTRHVALRTARSTMLRVDAAADLPPPPDRRRYYYTICAVTRVYAVSDTQIDCFIRFLRCSALYIDVR